MSYKEPTYHDLKVGAHEFVLIDQVRGYVEECRYAGRFSQGVLRPTALFADIEVYLRAQGFCLSREGMVGLWNLVQTLN